MTEPEQTNQIEPMLCAGDVARLFNVSLRTVDQWRQRGQGPKYLKFGKTVRYRQSDVQAYIDAARVE